MKIDLFFVGALAGAAQGLAWWLFEQHQTLPMEAMVRAHRKQARDAARNKGVVIYLGSG